MTWIAMMNRRSVGLVVMSLLALPVQAMSLSDALKRSEQHDPAVPLSLATYAAEQQLGAQVSGALWPTVTADAALSRHENESESEFFGDFEEGYSSAAVGISARQPVFRTDWFAKGRQADALDAKADAGQEERMLRHFVRVAERYFAVLIAQDNLVLAQAEAKAIGESLADTQKRHEVGLVPGTDLKEAQARDDLAKARLILVRQELATAQDLLNESTGNGYVTLPVLPAEAALPALESADMSAWIAKARQANPRVLQAQESVEIAKSDLAAAKAGLMPTVDAVASYRHDDGSESRVGSKRNDARIGLELSVPLYQGGVQRARSREAVARLDVAEAELARVLAEVDRQTRQQYRELEAAYAQEKALKLAVNSAISAEEATNNGYQAGTRTITDVLNSRSAVISAQRDYSQTRYDLLLKRMQLKQLSAELTLEDFAEVDALLTTNN